MKLKLAAVALLGAGSLVGAGTIPAAGVTGAGLASPARSTVAASACHRAPSPPAPQVSAGALVATQFVSATTGWVVGANRVLATTDGGAHWSRQRSAPGADYTEVDAINATHAWVVGRHQLIVTTNGGTRWRSLPEPCPVISSVHFVSPKRGFAIAGGTLLRTGDAGRRWHAVIAPGRAQSVCFTSPQRGWLGAHGRIFRTVDGGRDWTLAVSTGPVAKHPRSQPDAIVECSGPDTGWAEIVGPGVASNQEEHVGYYLSDSGSRPIFAEQYFGNPHVHVTRESPGAYYAAFSAVDAADAVFVDTCAPCGTGTSPVGIAENDGATVLRPGRVGHINFALGAAFVSTADGWAVGEVAHYRKGTATWKIEHTADGGKHWATQYVE
jgi:photosystem II stability/assembly factor-like uncharacterized protein